MLSVRFEPPAAKYIKKLKDKKLKTLYREAIDKICNDYTIGEAKTGAHADIPHISAWVSYGSICFGIRQNANEVDVPFNIEGETRFAGGFFFAEAVEGGIIKNNTVAYIDRDKLPAGLRVRTRRDGDRFQLIGSGGGKKLKDFFIDRKVPRDQRNMPILFSGSDALFIPGYGISDKVKVEENTKRVLRVTYVAEQ